MSFPLTTPQIIAHEKTVTRRTGWRFLKPGDLVLAVGKARGRRRDERARPLAVLRIKDVRVEPLSRLVDEPLYAEDEIPREGFPCWSRAEFVETFRRTHGLSTVRTDITRIEFDYVDEPI